MERLWRRFIFWIERWTYDGIPGPTECYYALKTKNHSPEIKHVLLGRYLGFSIDIMACELGRTPERVRQYLLKGCRDLK